MLNLNVINNLNILSSCRCWLLNIQIWWCSKGTINLFSFITLHLNNDTNLQGQKLLKWAFCAAHHHRRLGQSTSFCKWRAGHIGTQLTICCKVIAKENSRRTISEPSLPFSQFFNSGSGEEDETDVDMDFLSSDNYDDDKVQVSQPGSSKSGDAQSFLWGWPSLGVQVGGSQVDYQLAHVTRWQGEKQGFVWRIYSAFLSDDSLQMRCGWEWMHQLIRGRTCCCTHSFCSASEFRY